MFFHFFLLVGLKFFWGNVLTLFWMGFSGLLPDRGGTKKVPSLNLSYISYNDETWHSYTLPKKDPKNLLIRWHKLWVIVTSAFFHQDSANFAKSRNKDIDCILIALELDQKNRIIWGTVLVQVQQFKTDSRYQLLTLHQCGKRVKNKSQVFWGANFYDCRNYRWKTESPLPS